MAQKFKKQKNLIRNADEYTRYYGGFRGVDFSSDHTDVHEQRLAYSINMYKDYRTGEGNAIETIPGYRRRFQAPGRVTEDDVVVRDRINGIHEFTYITEDGHRDKDILVHAGSKLYRWGNYPESVNVVLQQTRVIPIMPIDIEFECYSIYEITVGDGEPTQSDFEYSRSTKELTLSSVFRDYRDKDIKIFYYATEDSRELSEQTIFVSSINTSTLDPIELDFTCANIESVEVSGSIKYLEISEYDEGDTFIALQQEYWWNYRGAAITINYYESQQTEDDAIAELANNESKSFVFNNRLYIIDGSNYMVYYKSSNVDDFVCEPVSEFENTYIPTVYRGLALGNLAPEILKNCEYEQKNLLSPYFKHTYVANKKPQTTEEGEDENENVYPLYDKDIDPNEGWVTFYGGASFAISEACVIDLEAGTITFNDGYAPAPPAEIGYAEGYAGVEFTFRKSEESIAEDLAKINKCTIFATFDKRVFLSGNPKEPNTIWYCGYNNTVGREDATYFGTLDYVVDGVENAPITGLIAVADTLAAVKNHTKQDGSVYFHTRVETNKSVIPVTYPNEPGLSGIGCLGACVNFLDDPIFMSRLGVEAIGQLSVRLERAVEHRSSLIDAKLVNLNLKNARFCEWNGYLVVLVDGEIFMADSRQRYTHATGVNQYEWYYLCNIGVYENQEAEYYYAPVIYDYVPDKVTYDGVEYEVAIADHIYNLENGTSENRVSSPVRVDISDNEPTDTPTVFIQEQIYQGVIHLMWFVRKKTWDGITYENGEPKTVVKAILCDNRGSYTGGDFYPARKIVTISGEKDDNIFFGTDNGVICSFNFDKKNSDGTLSPKWYSFDNRTIYCGVATKMDNCGIPHLTKSTIKKSTVIKTKSMIAAVAKVRVRTNKKGYENVARVNSRIFSFDDLDFSDFSFVSSEQTIFAIKEKEKHWVEKQHWIYSDEYQRPFSINYLAFRYKISGRIKG